MQDFLVDIVTTIPSHIPPGEARARNAAEARRVKELWACGSVVGLWRTPSGHTLGLWRAYDEADLRQNVLATLPLRCWMKVSVTRLTAHPNDPAPQAVLAGNGWKGWNEMMRLPLLTAEGLSVDQRELYDDIVDVIEEHFGELVTRRHDGALIGPFNGWLHFPQFGRAAWAFNKALWEHRSLADDIHQLVILVTAEKFGARYQISGHEYFARRAGLSTEKIATVLAGQRPVDFSSAEQVAYDLATALNRGMTIAETTYRAEVAEFGETGVAEIVFLVGCFSMVAVTLNAFDYEEPDP